MIHYKHMQPQEPLTCESLKRQYQVLQDIADEYKALLKSEGHTSEKTKELRTTFDTQTENLRNNIVIYKKEKQKEKQEGIFYLSAEYRSGEEYLKALEEKGYKFTAPDMELYGEIANIEELLTLTQFTNIPKEQIRLKKVTPEDLGFSEESTLEEILVAAKKHNLKPCPPWVGPQYRLECEDDENAIIGMEPLVDSYGNEYIFGVSHDDHNNPYITGIPSDADAGSSCELVFAFPK